MPLSTLDAFRDHGRVARTVDDDVGGADAFFSALQAAGISFSEVTDKLLVDGVASFQKSFDAVVSGLERKVLALVGSR
jgi:transaldolase